jgi:hypothetical protein
VSARAAPAATSAVSKKEHATIAVHSESRIALYLSFDLITPLTRR